MKTIRFDRPAKMWEEALPIGNGRLGAMIFGGTQKERVALNQDSIWYGAAVDRINPEAKGRLGQVRSLLLKGKIPEAEDLLRFAFSGIPQSQRPYQPLGDIEITYGEGGGGSQDYSRALDLERGLVTETYRLPGRRVKKEYLSSYVHGVIAIHMEALEGTISLEAILRRGRFYDHSGKLDDRTIYMDGVLGEGGVRWIAALRAETESAHLVLGEHLIVRGAKELTLYLSCETSFYGEDYRQVLADRLDAAERDGYEEVRRRHEADYQRLYGRVSLKIGPDREDEAGIGDTADQLFAKGRADGFDASFASLYFQYGRYLMISGSRPGSLPLTLQGIWNEEMEPAWDSKYTININTEMNYWPAEICGLAECHMPLFDHILRMWENGRRTAREMYGCRGFTAHHNTDIWGDCAPQDIYVPATYWVMGAAWLCTHIWRHYVYTRDDEFLKRFYPVVEDAVLFFHDFLIEEDGKMLTCPSVSPENTYILPDGTKGCMGLGSAMDNEILRDLMEGYLKASEILKVENAVTEETKRILSKIPPLQIGKHGQIMEWREDYEEMEPGHRHISQLYGLHPSCQITPDRTPELAEAARTTLERRLHYGGGHTGWSRAWIVNFYARLWDGEKAYDNLNRLWSDSTFVNLMDNHPRRDGRVFQIDGNLGAVSAIAEMLVQSDEERIILLPALPKAWSEGRIRGLGLAGGGTVELVWRNGEPEKCVITSPRTRKVTVRYRDRKRTVRLSAGEAADISEWICANDSY